MSERIKKTETIDISKFLTMQNEKEGVWHKLIIGGVDTHISLKLLGANSNKATLVNDKFKKRMSEIAAIKNEAEKTNAAAEAFAERCAGFCIDIRGDDGKEVIFNGKRLTVEDLKEVMMESPLIEKNILDFVGDTENFLGTGN